MTAKGSQRRRSVCLPVVRLLEDLGDALVGQAHRFTDLPSGHAVLVDVVDVPPAPRVGVLLQARDRLFDVLDFVLRLKKILGQEAGASMTAFVGVVVAVGLHPFGDQGGQFVFGVGGCAHV